MRVDSAADAEHVGRWRRGSACPACSDASSWRRDRGCRRGPGRPGARRCRRWRASGRSPSGTRRRTRRRRAPARDPGRRARRAGGDADLGSPWLRPLLGAAAQRDAGAVRAARSRLRRRPGQRRSPTPAGARARGTAAGAPRAESRGPRRRWRARGAGGRGRGGAVAVGGAGGAGAASGPGRWAIDGLANLPRAVRTRVLRRLCAAAGAEMGALGQAAIASIDRVLCARAGPRTRSTRGLRLAARAPRIVGSAAGVAVAARSSEGAVGSARGGGAGLRGRGRVRNAGGVDHVGWGDAGLAGGLPLCSPVRATRRRSLRNRREAANKDPPGVARPDRRGPGAGQHVQHQPRGRRDFLREVHRQRGEGVGARSRP
jgi:hypothetical protein